MANACAAPKANGEFRVAVCMDGSKHSSFALQFYKSDIHKEGYKVYILFCGQFEAMPVAPIEPHVMAEIIQKEEDKNVETQGHIQQVLHQLQLEAEVCRLHGDVRHAILKKCEELQADMIIVGSRGKGLIRRTLMGSVSDHLVHHSHVPVLVCRHEDFHKH